MASSRAATIYSIRRSQLRIEQATLHAQLNGLADQARAKLSTMNTMEMAEFFDLIQLDLERVGAEKFEGTASIPLPADCGEIR